MRLLLLVLMSRFSKLMLGVILSVNGYVSFISSAMSCDLNMDEWMIAITDKCYCQIWNRIKCQDCVGVMVYLLRDVQSISINYFSFSPVLPRLSMSL